MMKRVFFFGAVAAILMSVPVTAIETAFSYQGRLSDAGSPADGDYDFQFILFTAEIGGSQIGPILYGDDVQVVAGYFTIYLDFGPGVFDGTNLWLDVAVRDGGAGGSYTPLVPRHAILPSPYSLHSATVTWGDIKGMPAEFADGTDDDTTYSPGNQLDLTGDTFDVVEGPGSGLDADTIDGQQASAFAPTSHPHSGAEITTGTIAEPRIHDSLARDAEVMPTVLANDGPGSNLDADRLDGLSSNSFADSMHYHSGTHITTGVVSEPRLSGLLARDSEVMYIVLDGDGPGSGLNADLLDGHSSSHFEPTFLHGNGLDLIGGVLSIDPTEFNGANPISASSVSGLVSSAGEDVWVNVQSLTMTPEESGVVLVIGTMEVAAPIFAPSGGVVFIRVGIGVGSADPTSDTAITLTSAPEYDEVTVFETYEVTGGAEIAFRLKFANSSASDTFWAGNGRLFTVFIPN